MALDLIQLGTKAPLQAHRHRYITPLQGLAFSPAVVRFHGPPDSSRLLRGPRR